MPFSHIVHKDVLVMSQIISENELLLEIAAVDSHCDKYVDISQIPKRILYMYRNYT